MFNVRGPITFVRAVSQFGTEIPDELKHSGIGLNLRYTWNGGDEYLGSLCCRLDRTLGFHNVSPTRVFSRRLVVVLAGVELELVHAPGETDDQVMVWWPDKRVLFPADNIYRAFPNL